MMWVDLDRCSGCGECLEVCPVEAIALVGGKAAIDQETCLLCGACQAACPQEAISETRLSVLQTQKALQPVRAPEAPAPFVQTGGRFSWAAPLVAYIGREIIPLAADALIAALDRRSAGNSEAVEPIRIRPARTGSDLRSRAPLSKGKKRQNRQRRRSRKFNI